MPKYKYFIDYDEVIARREAGESVKDIAEDLQVPTAAIYRQLKKYKKNWCVRAKKGGKTGKEPMPLDIEALKKLQDEGHTLRQIGAMYNCSAATIFRRLGYKHARQAWKKTVLLEFKGLDGLDICVRPEDVRYIQRCPNGDEDHGKLCVHQSMARVFTIVDYYDAVWEWRKALEDA